MNNTILLSLQLIISTLASVLIFYEYIHPRLSKLSFEGAVLPMILVHTLRFTGLTMLAVGQVEPSIPQAELIQMAWGDYFSAAAALIAAYALWRRSRLVIPLIWLFVLVSIADLGLVSFHIISINFFSYDIGTIWAFLTWYLPWVGLSLIYVLYRLVNRVSEPLAA
ncbi:MAG: hypothetical protein AAF633_03645 [Chloroflexota bacterium]